MKSIGENNVSGGGDDDSIFGGGGDNDSVWGGVQDFQDDFSISVYNAKGGPSAGRTKAIPMSIGAPKVPINRTTPKDSAMRKKMLPPSNNSNGHKSMSMIGNKSMSVVPTVTVITPKVTKLDHHDSVAFTAEDDFGLFAPAAEPPSKNKNNKNKNNSLGDSFNNSSPNMFFDHQEEETPEERLNRSFGDFGSVAFSNDQQSPPPVVTEKKVRRGRKPSDRRPSDPDAGMVRISDPSTWSGGSGGGAEEQNISSPDPSLSSSSAKNRSKSVDKTKPRESRGKSPGRLRGSRSKSPGKFRDRGTTRESRVSERSKDRSKSPNPKRSGRSKSPGKQTTRERSGRSKSPKPSTRERSGRSKSPGMLRDRTSRSSGDRGGRSKSPGKHRERVRTGRSKSPGALTSSRPRRDRTRDGVRRTKSEDTIDLDPSKLQELAELEKGEEKRRRAVSRSKSEDLQGMLGRTLNQGAAARASKRRSDDTKSLASTDSGGRTSRSERRDRKIDSLSRSSHGEIPKRSSHGADDEMRNGRRPSSNRKLDDQPSTTESSSEDNNNKEKEKEKEKDKKRRERARAVRERRREEEAKVKKLQEEAKLLEEKRLTEEARLNALKEEANALEMRRKDLEKKSSVTNMDQEDGEEEKTIPVKAKSWKTQRRASDGLGASLHSKDKSNDLARSLHTKGSAHSMESNASSGEGGPGWLSRERLKNSNDAKPSLTRKKSLEGRISKFGSNAAGDAQLPPAFAMLMKK